MGNNAGSFWTRSIPQGCRVAQARVSMDRFKKRRHRDDAEPCRSSSAAQPAASAEECQNTSTGVSSSSAAQPAQHVTLEEWSLTPSRVQKPVRPEELTHTRVLPLAATIDVFIDGVQLKGQYQGRGKSKIVYFLTDTAMRHKWAGKVLKLCETLIPNQTFSDATKILACIRVYMR